MTSSTPPITLDVIYSEIYSPGPYPKGALRSFIAAKEALAKYGKIWLGDRTGMLKIISLKALTVQQQFRVRFDIDDKIQEGTLRPFMVYKLGTDEKGFFFENYWFAYAYHIQEKNR